MEIRVYHSNLSNFNRDHQRTNNSCRNDPELSKTRTEMLQNGEENIELFLEEGIIFKGERILIPKKLQPQILEELHHMHPGQK